MRKHKRKTCLRMGLWVRFEVWRPLTDHPAFKETL